MLAPIQHAALATTQVALENYDDTNYGYLRVVATATRLREYHSASDRLNTKAPNDDVRSTWPIAKWLISLHRTSDIPWRRKRHAHACAPNPHGNPVRRSDLASGHSMNQFRWPPCSRCVVQKCRSTARDALATTAYGCAQLKLVARFTLPLPT